MFYRKGSAKIGNSALYKVRVDAGLTQAALAKTVGVSPSTIARYERLLCFPTLRTRIRLARVLGADADYLFPEWCREAAIARRRERKEESNPALELWPKSSDKYNDPLLEFEKLQRHDVVEACLAQIGDREGKILRLHYGLDDKEMTLEEIGKELGISKQRVSQLEERALYKFKLLAIRTGLIENKPHFFATKPEY